jgi:uncharacterized protein YraI
MMTSLKIAILLAAGLVLPGTALAATAVATRPASIHATPSVDAKVLGLIGVSQTVDAKGCKKGWCQVAGGYVQTSYLRFIRVRKGYENSYDYNVPLALPPYGYAPGFWGYGGRRYYDQFGNYAKYGQRGYAGPPSEFDTRPAEIPRRGLFGPR